VTFATSSRAFFDTYGRCYIATQPADFLAATVLMNLTLVTAEDNLLGLGTIRIMKN